jgi:intracellular sulfur oxidation DsrE/DsrF family protein
VEYFLQLETIMSKFGHIAKVATIGVGALLFAVPLSAAQEGVGRPTTKPPATTHNPQMSARPASSAPGRNRAAIARMDKSFGEKDQLHRLILQVNTNDPAAMNLALNNAMNVAQNYKDLGEKVEIEVITFGPGLHMLRDDTSPVKARIETMALSTPEVSFKACGNTQENMHKAENKDIPIIPQAQVVKSGVVRIMELEERGWTYVKP